MFSTCGERSLRTGKSFNRGHQLPEQFKDGRTGSAFGVAGEVKPTSSQVKDLVFPIDTLTMEGDDDDSQAHRMYIKTHGNYAPGEQRRRGYDWGASGIDPDTATFGGLDKEQYLEGVAKAINPQRDAEKKTGCATIIDKRVEDFKSTNNDELGRAKNLPLQVTGTRLAAVASGTARWGELLALFGAFTTVQITT